MSFYKHFAVSLALEWFCTKNAFVYTPRLSPKIWSCSPRVRSMSSVVQWARSGPWVN